MPLMDSKLNRTFINSLIIIAGPSATIWLAMKNKGGSIEPWWPFVLVIFIYSIITITIAIAVYLSRKTIEDSVKRSTIYSIAIYVIIAIGYSFLFDHAEVMWLPIAIPFLIILSIPMALFVSLGTIRILKDMRVVSNTLEDTTKEAENRIKEFIKLNGFECNVFSIAANDLDPSHCVFWVTIKTDMEKEKILKVENLKLTFFNILRSVGYPADAIQSVQIAVESQETVDRDYIGNWWHATRMKKKL
jgi:hypothetical protein